MEQNRFQTQIGDLLLSWSIGVQEYTNSATTSHFHGFFELHYIVDGCLLLKDDRQTSRICQGEAALVPPDTFHRSDSLEEGFSRVVFSFFLNAHGCEMDTFSEYTYFNRILRGYRGIHVLQDPLLAQYAQQLIRLCPSVRPEDGSRKNLLFSVMLSRIVQLLEENPAEPQTALPMRIDRTPEQEKQLFLIEDCIQNGYNSANLPEVIAQTLHMSRRNASRMVERFYGAPVSEIALRYRMDHAKILICNTSLKLTEIAESVGYQTYTAFFVAFKKYYGVTPELFRKANTEQT